MSFKKLTDSFELDNLQLSFSFGMTELTELPILETLSLGGGQALYQAKQKGRDQTLLFNHNQPSSLHPTADIV